MTVKNYDPALYRVIFAGSPITGFGDGTWITASRRNPTWSLTAGADGEVARAKSNDKTGSVVFTLLQSSASNDVLSALHLTDELTGNGVGPILVQDLNGTTVLQGETAFVEKPADVTLAKEVEGREWTILVGKFNMLVGGSLAASSA
jgi:hypothetical protein